MCQHPDFEAFMKTAIALAQKGAFATFPNPNVGAVLVRDNKIVAQGWHTGKGRPHAEIECLNNAKAQGIDPKGATMVVTLEPCRHQGATPPCVNAILDAGITTLAYGCEDPNPEARGGAEILKQAGLNVIGPVLEQDCKDLIADFTIWQTGKRPYVILKLAATLDGKIATRSGHSRWISNETSRALAHRFREGVGRSGGAILIGGNTFRMDNPALTARPANNAAQPLAAVMTSRLPKATANFTLIRDRPEQTVFFTSPAVSASPAANELRSAGCRVIPIGTSQAGTANFGQMLDYLRNDLGCPHVLCEGGGKLALSLLERDMVDEFHLFLAPMILGDNDAPPLFSGRSPLTLEEAIRMRLCETDCSTGDAHLCYRPK